MFVEHRSKKIKKADRIIQAYVAWNHWNNEKNVCHHTRMNFDKIVHDYLVSFWNELGGGG